MSTSRFSVIGRTVVVGLLFAVVSCSQQAGQIAVDLPDRSVLSLAGDAAGNTGRFTISDGSSTYFVSRLTIPRLTGRYWVTETGNVYTDFDVDTDLIASELASLTNSMSGAYQSDSFYEGSEYQVVFADLLSWVGLTLPIEFTRQFNAAFEASGREVEDPETLEPILRPGCLRASEESEVAIGQWALSLDPEFEVSSDGLETWEVPLDELYSVPEFEAMEAACTDPPPGSSETDDRHRVRVTREEADGATRLVISVDRADYVGNEYDSALEIMMTPDDGIGDPPDAPDPSGLLTTLGSYMVTISECGELPYVRTEIFEVNYTGPDDPMYFGPSYIASGWACEDEVPSD